MNDKKKFLWVYALVMCVSAFTILLMTAYSQIKYEKSNSQIKFELTKRESQVKDFSINLQSVTDKKRMLEEQNKNLQSIVVVNNKKIVELNTYIQNTKTSYENILKAQTLYRQGNYNESCNLLLLVDNNLLGDEMQKIYSTLKKNVFPKISVSLFSQGRKYYNHKQYDLAVLDFEKLLIIDEDRKYQKSTINYLINSYQSLGNTEKKTFYENILKDASNL